MKVSAALLRQEMQTVLGPRWEAAFRSPEGTGRESIRSMAGEIPRGAMTEIAGPASSGRTSLLYSLLATATAEGECCALLDTGDAFDPASAAEAGVRLSQVLWVRCGGSVENALKAADLLAPAGGFGLVAIDLGETPSQASRRIPLAAWFRLRNAVENTRTALLVLGQQIHAHSCSALKIQLSRRGSAWEGRLAGCLLDRFDVTAKCTRQHRPEKREFSVSR